jgi:hypothetical protein
MEPGLPISQYYTANKNLLERDADQYMDRTMWSSYATHAFLLSVLFGCRVSGTQHADVGPSPGEKAGTRVHKSMLRATADDSMTTDRLSDINPSPEHDTIRGLLVLEDWVLARREKTGLLASRLEEIVPPDTNNAIYKPYERWWSDGWQRRFLYRVSNGRFEIRSAGADGISGNSDDYFVP